MVRATDSPKRLDAERAAQVQKQERFLTDLEHQLDKAKSDVKEIKAKHDSAYAELRRLITGAEQPLPFEVVPAGADDDEPH